MAVTITGLDILTHLLLRRGIGQKIANAQIGSIAATSLTSVFYFRNTNWGENELINLGAGFWRPGNATGIADDWRPAGVLTPSTGAVTVDTWADTTLGTEDIYQLNYRCHPQYIIEAMNAALRDVYFQNEDPISLAQDAGFQDTAVSGAWTQSNATLTKQTTQVFPTFIRAGNVDITTNNGFIRQDFECYNGDQIYAAALINQTGNPGSGNLQLLIENGETGTALVTVTNSRHSGWIYMWGTTSVSSSSGVVSLSVKLLGQSATSSDFRLQGLWVYRTRNLLLPLATTWDTRFKMPELSYLQLNTNEGGIADAFSAQKIEIPEDDYDFLLTRPGATPYAVQFHTDKYFGYPILIQGRRAHSDLDGPFTRVLTETTSADLDLMEAATARRLFMDERIMLPDRLQRLAKAEYEFNQLDRQFEWEGPARPRRFVFMGQR
jgi:hypothetical protein